MKCLTHSRVYLLTFAVLLCGTLEAKQSDLYGTWKPVDQYTRFFSPREIDAKMSQLKKKAKATVAGSRELQGYVTECENAKKYSDTFYFKGIRARNIQTFAISKNQLRIEYYEEPEKSRKKRVQEIMRSDLDPNLTRAKAEKMVDAEVHVPSNLKIRNCKIIYWDDTLFQACGNNKTVAAQPFFIFKPPQPPKKDQFLIRMRRTPSENQDVFIAMRKVE